MSCPVLVDTGPIVAILSKWDDHHQACVHQLRQFRAPLLTCWPVLTEAAWLLLAYPNSIAKLLSSFGGRPFGLATLTEPDLPGIGAIFAKYENLGLQLADASLLHLANREGLDTVFTLDRRHFGVVRLANGNKLRLIP